MAGEWWEELPDADGTASAAQEPQPTAPTPGGAWYEALPDATPTGPNTVSQEEFRQQRGGGRAGPAQPSAKEIARRSGIEVEGAPADLRASYLKLPPATRNELTQYMVDSYFAKRGHSQHVPVAFNEQLDVHLFEDPADGKWKPLNDLGMDWEDAKDLMKYVVAPTAGAVGAGIAGTVTGSPFLGATAALLADTTIAGGFRAQDVQDLINEGLIPPDALSPGVEGAKEAAWATAGAATGAIIGRTGRKFISGVDDIPMATDVDRKMISDMMERYEKQYGDTMPDLPLDKRMQLVAKTDKEKAATVRVQSRREALERSSATQKVMVDRIEKNKQDLANGLSTFMTMVGRGDENVVRPSGLNADQILAASSRIIDGLEAPARAELARYDQAVTEAYQKADDLANGLMTGMRDPRELPVSVKGVFDAAHENFRANMSRQYDEIAEATRGQKVFDIKPLREELSSLRAKMLQDAKFRKMILGEGTQGVAPRQDIRIGAQGGAEVPPEDEITEIIFGEAFRREGSGLLLSDAARRELANDTVFGYDAINSALLSLRKRIRELPKSAGTDTVAQLSRIERVLEDVRDAGLRSIDEGLADQQLALDATYKLGKDALDRGIGRKLADQYLEPRPNREGVLLPSTFNKLFKGDAGAETARDIRTLMDMDVIQAGPNRPVDMLGVIDNIRAGLKGQLNDMMTEYGAKGGRKAKVITPEQFNKFRRDYKDALELAFTPEQIKRMKDATSMKRVIENAEADVRAVKTAIKEFPWGKGEIAEDPAKLMRATWPGMSDDISKVRRSRQLRDALRRNGDPESLMRDYRTLIAHDMMTNVSDGAGGVDPYKLTRYLANNEELLKEWYTSAGRSGTDMVEGMKAHAKIGRAILERSGLSHIEKDRMMEALNSVSRAYVGLFTTPGRILTAIKQLAGGQSISKEADFILNPEKYVKNQEFYEVLNSREMRALTRAGGHAIINAYRQGEEAEESPSTPLYELLGQ